MKHFSTVAMTAAALLILGGCASPAPAAPSSAPTVAAPTPAPTPTQKTETGLEQPAQIVDGDCASIATDARASELVGEAVELYVPADFDGVNSARVRVVGGLNCAWNSKNYEAGISLSAVPTQAAPVVSGPNDCGPGRLEGFDGHSCMFDFISSGIRFSGQVSTPTAAVSQQAHEQLLAVLREMAAEQTAIAPIPAPNAWANPVDCEALQAAIAVDFLGPETKPSYYMGGHDGYVTPIHLDLWQINSDRGSCSWESGQLDAQGAYVTVEPLGGAAFLEDELVASGDYMPLDLGGVGRGFERKDHTGTIFVFDGPNVLEMYGTPSGEDDSEKLGKIAQAVIAAMDSL